MSCERTHGTSVIGLTKPFLASCVIALTITALSGCGGSSQPSDSAVANALQTLLSSNGITVGGPTCVHQTGSQYTCQVLTTSGFTSYQVTDDGHAISADGFASP